MGVAIVRVAFGFLAVPGVFGLEGWSHFFLVPFLLQLLEFVQEQVELFGVHRYFKQ